VKRVLVPIAGASLAAALLVGVCYGVLRVTLPTSSKGQRLAIRTLGNLDRWRSHGAVLQIGGRTLTAHCTSVRRGAVVSLGDGSRILVRGRRVHALATRVSARERQLAAARPVDPELVSAEALLGGSRSLIVAGLAVRLAVGTEPLAGETRVGRTPAYVFLLGRSEKPRIELLVSQRTLEPLGVRYASARLQGSSRLLPKGARQLASLGRSGC
jgi:hypothetical protein